MWLIFLNDCHQVFQGCVRKLVVDSEWPGRHHDLHSFTMIALLVLLQLTHCEAAVVGWGDGWLDYPRDIELLGIHESFRNDDLSFVKGVLLYLLQIELELALKVVIDIEEANALVFHFWIFV